MTGSATEAKRYALKLLHYRSRSEKEIIQRLKRKGFDDNHINDTVEFLTNAELIKDDVLASELFRNATENKLLGRKGIQAFLSNRGIKKDLVTETLSRLSEDTEKETALRLVEKKLKLLKNQPNNVRKRRLWGMLERRGFSADVIHTAIKSINDKKS